MGSIVRQVGASLYNAIAETLLYSVTDRDGYEQRSAKNCLIFTFQSLDANVHERMKVGNL